MTTLFSPGEIAYVQQSVEQNMRSDGRSRTQIRHADISVGVISRAYGSSHVTLGEGTEVLVGVYGEIIPNPEGSLSIHVDCTPAVTTCYAAGSSTSSLYLAKEVFTHQLSSHLNALYASAPRERSELILIPGGISPGSPAVSRPSPWPIQPDPSRLSLFQSLRLSADTAWGLKIDLSVMGSLGGNVPLGATLALKAALCDTRLPRVEGALVGGEARLVQEDRRALGGAWEVPLSTLVLCTPAHYVVDPTLQEESVPATGVLVSTDPRGEIWGVQTTALGTRTQSPGPLPAQDLLCVVREAPGMLQAAHEELEARLGRGKGGSEGSSEA